MDGGSFYGRTAAGSTEIIFTPLVHGVRGVATGVYRYIYPKSVYLKFFYVVVLCPCDD